MSFARRVTRRTFLLQSASTAFGVPIVLSASALGLGDQIAPNERINLAAIGVGGRGSGVFNNLARRAGVQPLAACDVQASRLRRFADQGLAVYRDFRELLALAETFRYD